MSSFLQLVNRARRECGVSGPDLPTLAGQLSKEGQRFADWINEAWRNTQMHRQDWSWMRKAASFDTAAGVGTYSPTAMGAADIDDWIGASFRSYLKSAGVAGEQFMTFVDHNDFRDRFGFSTLRTTPGMPLWLTATADRSLQLWPVPAGVYTIVGEYRRAATEMAADADTPATGGLPERFHMLLVYKAMMLYAGFEAAPEVMDSGQRGAARYMAQLEAWDLPVITMAGALA